MKFDVLIISFSQPSTDARTLNLASTLTKIGKSVCIIALKDNFNKQGINFIPIDIDLNQRMIKRWFQFYQLTKNYKNKIAANIVIAEDLYSLPIMIKFFSKSAGKRIYDSREIYSALGPLKGKSIKQKIISFTEKKYIFDVDEIIVSGQMDSEYLKDYYDIKVPFRTIMNLPPYKEPIRSNKFREELHIPDERKIILYQGEILDSRGLKASVDALKSIHNIDLCIVGSGPYLSQLKVYVSDSDLDSRVHFLSKVPYIDLHSITSSADLGLTLFEPVSKSYELALPNKLFEYCMAGVPSIASDLDPIRKVVEEDEIATLIPKDDINGIRIAEAIKELFNSDKYDKLKANCIAVSKKYSYETQEESISEMCK